MAREHAEVSRSRQPRLSRTDRGADASDAASRPRLTAPSFANRVESRPSAVAQSLLLVVASRKEAAVLVQDLMTKDPLTVPLETPITEARRMMGERRIRHLLVTDARRLAGIVTDRDIRLNLPSPATSLSVWEINYLIARLSVDSVMTRPVITVDPRRALHELRRSGRSGLDCRRQRGEEHRLKGGCEQPLFRRDFGCRSIPTRCRDWKQRGNGNAIRLHDDWTDDVRYGDPTAHAADLSQRGIRRSARATNPGRDTV